MNNLIFNFFFSLSSIPFIAGLALFISNIFIYIISILTIIIIYFINRDIVNSFLILFTGIFAFFFSYIIKIVTMINRPFVELGLTPLFMETGFSFPSSHVTVISAISTIMWSIDYRFGIFFFILTILIALSRMVIGVHYPIDVLFGIVFGVLIGLLALWFYNVTGQFAFLRKYI